MAEIKKNLREQPISEHRTYDLDKEKATTPKEAEPQPEQKKDIMALVHQIADSEHTKISEKGIKFYTYPEYLNVFAGDKPQQEAEIKIVLPYKYDEYEIFQAEDKEFAPGVHQWFEARKLTDDNNNDPHTRLQVSRTGNNNDRLQSEISSSQVRTTEPKLPEQNLEKKLDNKKINPVDLEDAYLQEYEKYQSEQGD